MAKAKTAAAKKVADDKEEDKDDDEDDEPPAKKAMVDSAPKKKVDIEGTDDLQVFVGGLPFSTTEEQLRKDFSECGEIESLKMPKNEEDRPRGFAFITFKTKEGVQEALKYDGDDYGGRRLKVNRAGAGKGEKGKCKGEKGKGDKGKGKGEKGKGRGNDELTVFVRGLSFDLSEETVRKDFEDCGEVKSLRMPLNEEGKFRGIAFIEYAAKEGVTKALEFDGQEYSGRTLGVRMVGDREEKGKGKGKDGKGKDGKGKGKGKGKKGMSTEKMAAKDGAMVESTGKKQTFNDSDDDDDDEEPAPKKKAAPAKKPVDDDDDDSSDEPPAKPKKAAAPKKKAPPPPEDDSDEDDD